MFNKNRVKLLQVLGVILLSLSFCKICSYAGEGKGSSGCSFLLVDADAKVSSLGGAHTAMIGGIRSICVNPAGIVVPDRTQAAFIYNRAFCDTIYSFASLLHSNSLLGTVGISILYSSVGKVYQKDRFNPHNTGKILSCKDMIFLFSYGKAFSKLHLGGNLKLISSNLTDISAKTFAVDAGAIFRVNPKIRIGFSVLNAGGALKFIEIGDKIPLTLKAGICCFLLKKKLTILSDIGKVLDSGVFLQIGADFKPVRWLSLRAGYTTGPKEEGIGLSCGLGVKIGSWGLDFSWVPYGELGSMLRVGVIMGL
jgi:hypothetical protein